MWTRTLTVLTATFAPLVLLAGAPSASAPQPAVDPSLLRKTHDGEITRARASELARLVLCDNAKKLYGFQ